MSLIENIQNYEVIGDIVLVLFSYLLQIQQPTIATITLLFYKTPLFYLFANYLDKYLIKFHPIPCGIDPNLDGFYIWFNDRFVIFERYYLGEIKETTTKSIIIHSHFHSKMGIH